MRYAQGGGFTPQEQQRRQRVRLQAAEMFARNEKNAQIARILRVTERSVERWRRAWREGGEGALVSKGPPARPKLTPAQFAQLEVELERGPLAHGFADQRWTLTRIKILIERIFLISYTVPGVWTLLQRNGWSCQRPVQQAIKRDEAAIEVWKKETWPQAGRRQRRERLDEHRRPELP
ncbi:winged helix-turn-helix domain-containing protein [Sphaerimonospora sp. CA-214678]|uniref:winged helix-turn-helix domain-containing protein n=1 Tax=Sphaerimonospora sp. CA-214678 TaxID=3240029 RepID=UPI003D8FFF0A